MDFDGTTTLDQNYIDTPIIANSNNANTSVTINPTYIVTKGPLYLQILDEFRIIPQPKYDFLRELKNLHIRIPLLQAIKDVPIYVKIVRDLCVEKPGRKMKYNVTIHVMGKMSELMTGQLLLNK